MNPEPPIGLFQAAGIELEYMIVDAETLAVRPIADKLLAEVGGSAEQEVELGPVAWSNELALHVIEMKTNGPRASLAGLGATFQDSIAHMERLLEPLGARLMPTGMHPLMEPERELKLWPHENDLIYRTFDRIFDCRGHGWANLQSMHINLPFAGDREFGRLHAAMRVILPILPALAASSPICDGQLSGRMDTRMHVYRGNARRVPSVSGVIVPEPVFTRAAYEGQLLQRVYDDLAPHDPDGVLRFEWVNARGCIARFDRSALEIRVLDLQECPRADIAVAGAIIAVVHALVKEDPCSSEAQRAFSEHRLADILWPVVDQAEHAVISDPHYLRLFGLSGRERVSAGDLWHYLLETYVRAEPDYPEWAEALAVIAEHGCLARRIERALGPEPDIKRIRAVYRRLAECLRTDTLFLSDDNA
jgi:carboxylate-amine ligase